MELAKEISQREVVSLKISVNRTKSVLTVLVAEDKELYLRLRIASGREEIDFTAAFL